jgi:hypothetical protein
MEEPGTASLRLTVWKENAFHEQNSALFESKTIIRAARKTPFPQAEFHPEAEL